MVNLGCGGSSREGLAPAGVTADATPLPVGAGAGLGAGFVPAVAAALPPGGCAFTPGLGGVTDFFDRPRCGVVVDGDEGTVVGGVTTGTVVDGTARGVGVGGVGVAGTPPGG
jgi:hypothetical protein